MRTGDLLEVQIVTAPEGVGAAGMEERAPPVSLLGHDVGVGGGRLGGGAEVADVNLVLAAGVADVFAEGVLADQAGGEEREGRAGLGEINQDVVRRAAGALGLAANVGELFGLRIDINHLDLVNDPVAPGEEAAAVICASILHGGRVAVCANSE